MILYLSRATALRLSHSFSSLSTSTSDKIA
jgi:hypothetical protein